MSDAIVLAETRALSKELSASQLLPVALRKRPEDVLAIVLAGQEMGLAPMQSIRGINIIDGKIQMSAQLIAAVILRSPTCAAFEPIEMTETKVVYRAQRKGKAEVLVSYTVDDAKRAGLTGKSNHQKYPVDMLIARCAARAGRAVFPDLLMGCYDESENLEKEVGPSAPQKEHVEAVKEALKAQVTVDVVEGEVVKSGEAREKMLDRIALCMSLQELGALGPEIRAMSEQDREAIRATYMTRKTQLGGN